MQYGYETLREVAHELIGREISVNEGSYQAEDVVTEVNSTEDEFEVAYRRHTDHQTESIGGMWTWGSILMKEDGRIIISVPMVGTATVSAK